MTRLPAFVLSCALFGCAACWAPPAAALSASLAEKGPSIVGENASFRLETEGAEGVVEYRWDFGDGTRTEYTAGQSEVTHAYAAPGHYPVIVVVRDEVGFTSASFVQTVHYPVTPERPQSSSSIVYDDARSRIYVVNPDSDTVSAIDALTLTKVGEVAVYRNPEALALAPDGTLWVLHRDDYAVAVVEPSSFSVARGFRLPYASQPAGLVMSPGGDAAYVTLMALGELLELDPRTGEALRHVDVGPWPRGVAVSHDGRDVYVTRFLSGAEHGEVVDVDGASLEVKRRFQLERDETEDSAQRGRGVPNYLFSVGLSPDGRQAWIGAKKDNIARGLVRDGLELQQENTVRAMVSVLDLEAGQEALERRMDLDDRNLPLHVEFSPLGDYAFVTVAGSALVEVRDTATSGFVTALQDAGIAPRASVLGPEGKLFVHGYLSRNVVVYDVSELLAGTDTITKKLAEVATVDGEKLSSEVLRGKQLFYDSRDERMTGEGYLSCATCHFDGFEDGQVWDFSNLGEGLRNTTSLLGRRGTGHGPVHWSGNFDEIQDFEHPIRALFGGTGFLPEGSSLGEPWGAPKAGRSPELDALALYVASLAQVHPSPHRSSDGTLTELATRGEALFGELGCGECHAGPDFTDSALGVLHDVGTLKPSSGSRLGAALTGIDTPTLLGVWETAPYLHDGSAPTLRDVLTTSNPEDNHGKTSQLSAQQLDELVAYLLQLDGDVAPSKLPFEVDDGEQPPTDETGLDDSELDQSAEGCSCKWTGAARSSAPPWLFLGITAYIHAIRRRIATRVR